jgi:hypothetical protein
VLCCFIVVSCAKPNRPHISETFSRTVEARAGQKFAQYAVYNPEMTAEMGIEAEDVLYATGIFILMNPTLEKLKNLSTLEHVLIYYNRLGQVIIDVKGH